MTTISCESLFLLLEHDLLQASTHPDYVQPEHPVLTSSHMLPILTSMSHPTQTQNIKDVSPSGLSNMNLNSLLVPPTPQQSEHVEGSRHFVRCGVNQSFLAESAVEAILRPLLRKHRGLLPLGRWRAACLAAMHIVHTSLVAMIHSKRAQSSSEDGNTEVEEEHDRDGKPLNTNSKASSGVVERDEESFPGIDTVATGGPVAYYDSAERVEDSVATGKAHAQSQHTLGEVGSSAAEESTSTQQQTVVEGSMEASIEGLTEGSMEGGCMQWGELDGAMVAVLQKTLEVFYETLTEIPPQVCLYFFLLHYR